MNKALELTRKGFDLQEEGKYDEALAHYQEAILLDENMADAYTGMGNIFIANRRMEKALAAFLNAFNYYIDSPNEKAKLQYVCRHLAYIYRENGKYEQARKFLEYCSNDSVTYEKAILMPPVYNSWDDIKSHRQRCSDEIAKFYPDPRKEFASTYTHFYLSYHGLTDDFKIHKQIHDKLNVFFPESVCNWKKRKNPQKIRIGIFSSYLYDHSVAHCFASMFKHLNNDPNLEVYAITNVDVDDAWTKRVKAHCHKFVVVDNDLINARYEIKKLRLDVTAFLDIGMDTFSYQLAFTRMAPTTLCFGGHPVSTGIKNIDYFISSEMFHDYQMQYTEQLVKLSEPVVDYDKPKFTLIPREDIKQFPGGNVYTCPMTLFKVHPDMDHVIRMILEKDPDGSVLFFKFGDSGVHELLAQRMFRKNPQFAEKIYFREWAGRNEFISVMAHSKAVLDTLYFGAGNTSYAAMVSGTPIITFCPDNPEKSSARNSNTMTHYKQIDKTHGTDYVSKYVAWDYCQYAKMAVGVDEKIPSAHTDCLFNRTIGVQSLIDWLKAHHGKEEKN